MSVKERILEEALTMFVEYGVKQTTMDELAQQMGISKRTIYEHYADKKTLVHECIKYIHQRNTAYMDKVFAQKLNVIEALCVILERSTQPESRKWMKVVTESRKYYPAIFNAQAEEMQKCQEQSMCTLLKRGIEEEVFRPDINPELIAFIYTHQNNGVWKAIYDDAQHRFSAQEIFDNVILTSLRGISTQKGLEILDKNINKFINNTKTKKL